jgi:UPF0271 protein
MTIDLNADLGEGAAHDLELLDLVTSANVACGAHAGNFLLMRQTCEAARDRDVVVGAHPGYPDRDGFGRRELDMPALELRFTLDEQLQRLDEAARLSRTRVRYCKPHGALYHRATVDRGCAETLCAAVRAHDPGMLILGPPGSVLLGVAEEVGLGVVVEGFIDRGYELDKFGNPRLVDRDESGAMLGVSGAVDQALDLARGTLRLASGEPIALAPQSLCLHGDTPDAVTLATAAEAALRGAGVQIEAFA